MEPKKELKKKVKLRWLQINKCKIEIPREMSYKEYAIALMITVDNIERPDQHEGFTEGGEKFMFVDVVYKAKVLPGDIVIKDEYDKIYAKARKGSMSQVLRNAIRNNCTSSADLNDYYKEIMSGFIDFCPELIEYLEELKLKKAKGEL